MPMCGNCGESHPTLDMIRECHGAPKRPKGRTEPWRPDAAKIRTVTCLNPTCHEQKTGPVGELFGWKCTTHSGSTTTPSRPTIEVGQKVQWQEKNFMVLATSDEGVTLRTGAPGGKLVSWSEIN